MAGSIRVTYDGAVATLTNDNPDKHNAFDDEMDRQLFEAFAEIGARPEVRAVIWRADGKSFSSGRDVAAIGTNRTELTHHQLMQRGHLGIQQVLDLDVPIIVACKGWTIGGSFQRALLCDIRVAAEGARFMLPEVTHGVIPDTGGVARLFQMCGHGVVSDMILTGRVLGAEEALSYGVVSRVVPADELDDVVAEMAAKIAAAPPLTVMLARRVLGHLATPEVLSSMQEELLAQTVLTTSHDFAEFKAARDEGRDPNYVRG
jgi:enoyl-CoA hydratase/carnithine racemase